GSGTISDTATLAGATTTATGTITDRQSVVYGESGDTSICSSASTVAGNGPYTSGSFTPVTAGTYRWIANYGGDTNDSATANTCNGANETVVVSPRTPTIVTLASAAIPVGSGTISDTATLAGATTTATGTI